MPGPGLPLPANRSTTRSTSAEILPSLRNVDAEKPEHLGHAQRSFMLLDISDHNVKSLQAASPMHSARPAKAVDVRWQILVSLAMRGRSTIKCAALRPPPEPQRLSPLPLHQKSTPHDGRDYPDDVARFGHYASLIRPRHVDCVF